MWLHGVGPAVPTALPYPIVAYEYIQPSSKTMDGGVVNILSQFFDSLGVGGIILLFYKLLLLDLLFVSVR